MNKLSAHHWPGRGALLAGLAMAPGLLLGAGEPGAPPSPVFDLMLVIVVGLAVGLVVWGINLRGRKQLERQTARRIREMTALIEHADCMLWEAEVVVQPTTWRWHLKLHSSVFCRKLLQGVEPNPDVDLWAQFQIDDRVGMDRRARAAMQEGQPGYVQELRAVRDGQVYWLHENVSITPTGPDRYWLVGLVTDITSRHTAELARQTSEARLQEVLASANCLLWEGTVTLGESDWKWEFSVLPSGLCRKLYGTSQPSPAQGLWRTFDIPERAHMDQRCRSMLLAGTTAYEQVFHIVRPDGGEIWINESVTVRPLGGDKHALVGVAVDITAQRGAEEALAAEKERLAVTLRAMSESVITTDVTGLIQFINPAAASLTGWTVLEAVGRPVGEICRFQDSRTEQTVEVPIGQAARGNAVADLPLHMRLINRSGHQRQIEGCCSPINVVDGKVTGVVLVFRDVTEQERLEQELVRATRLESVGVLAGGIAHDFNNILTAVMGNLALAQLDIDSASAAGACLQSAEKATLRARDLTQQLLTFAKGGEPVRSAVQLVAIVREMTTFALHGSQVKAFYDLAPDLWPADADKGQIGRVVQNLALNAVQAMPHGGTLRVMARNDAHDALIQPGLARGDYIQIAITDTGEGIKPENLARVFDPYFTTKQAGTGLGLAAVYSIVKKHRGHIEVESQVGRGTTFRIWLPALREGVAPKDTRTPWGAPDLMKGRVLFMDDEPIIRDMAVRLLQRLGLSADTAIDGAEAVEKYRLALAAGARYDLVIMDLTVPGGMGGLAAVRLLREIDPAVKAVVSSGYSSDPVLANHRAHGFVAVVAKPYEVNELSRVLREVLAAA